MSTQQIITVLGFFNRVVGYNLAKESKIVAAFCCVHYSLHSCNNRWIEDSGQNPVQSQFRSEASRQHDV